MLVSLIPAHNYTFSDFYHCWILKEHFRCCSTSLVSKLSVYVCLQLNLEKNIYQILALKYAKTLKLLSISKSNFPVKLQLCGRWHIVWWTAQAICVFPLFFIKCIPSRMPEKKARKFIANDMRSSHNLYARKFLRWNIIIVLHKKAKNIMGIFSVVVLVTCRAFSLEPTEFIIVICICPDICSYSK